jgi:hypothetical protein
MPVRNAIPPEWLRDDGAYIPDREGRRTIGLELLRALDRRNESASALPLPCPVERMAEPSASEPFWTTMERHHGSGVTLLEIALPAYASPTEAVVLARSARGPREADILVLHLVRTEEGWHVDWMVPTISA